MSLSHAVFLCACLLLLAGGSFPSSDSQLVYPDEDDAKKIVVMVTGDLIGQGDVSGSGIIVGSTTDSLYVVTANHVVRRKIQGLGQRIELREARNVKVSFNFLPGESDARVHEEYYEDEDIAVLVLGRDQLSNMDEQLNYAILGTSQNLIQGNALYVMYNPILGEWRRNLDAYLFSELYGSTIEFESDRLTTGYSGTGLFDESLRLVGMVRRTTGGVGITQAVTIESVIRRMRGWGFPISLEMAPEIKSRKPIWPWVAGGLIAVGAGTTVAILSGSNDPDDFAPVPEQPAQ